jgi:ATP-dependent helicase/nuclease subunit A
LVISSFEPHQRGSAASWYQRLQPLAQPLDAPEAADGLPNTPAAQGVATQFVLPSLPAYVSLAGGVTEPDSEQPATELADEHTRIGLALHRLLQWCPTPAAGFEWTPTHVQAAAREFGLSLAQAQAALAMALRIVAGPAAWAWDAAQLDHWGNEVELFHQGELLRLDRLVRQRGTPATPGAWWVLDFKSAEHPERQPALLAQMRRYQQALADTRPGEAVRLAFINPLGLLLEITPEMLAT